MQNRCIFWVYFFIGFAAQYEVTLLENMFCVF